MGEKQKAPSALARQDRPDGGWVTPNLKKVIDTRVLPPRDRAEVWRAVAAPQFELSDLPAEPAATGVAYQLGPVILTRSRHPRQTMTRTAARTREDGVEDILCSMELSGSFGSVIGERHALVGVGSVSLFDLGQAAVKHGEAGETLCLKIDRDAWRAAAGEDADVHGVTLGAMAGLVRDHLLALERTVAENPSLASVELGLATIQLLAACARTEARREMLEPVRAQVSPLLIHRAEHYIRAHLGDPELSPERIARAVGVSRSGLYALFEPLGGVAGRVRTLRLELARAMLAGSTESRVGEIADRVGFRGVTQFNRAFKAHFGYPPGETRRGG